MTKHATDKLKASKNLSRQDIKNKTQKKCKE